MSARFPCGAGAETQILVTFRQTCPQKALNNTVSAHNNSPCSPAEARRRNFLDFLQGRSCRKFGGSFSDPKNKGRKIFGKISEHFL